MVILQKKKYTRQQSVQRSDILITSVSLTNQNTARLKLS